jgi:hypothetical protein
MKVVRITILSLVLCGTCFGQEIVIQGPLTYEIYEESEGTPGYTTLKSCAKWATGTVVIPATFGGYPVSIYPYAFRDCSGIQAVTISSGIDRIPFQAFERCTTLHSVSIPNSVGLIEFNAFRDCSSLQSISIPDSVFALGDFAFEGCSSLNTISLGNSLTSIGDACFELCTGLTSIDIPDSVTEIGDTAFLDCISLSCVTIGGGISTIGQYAFSYCESLSNITITGSSAPSIQSHTFEALPNDATIVYPLGGNGYGTSFGGIPTIGLDWDVNNGGVTVTDCDSSISGVVKLPEIIECTPVVSIGDYAFDGCESLTSVEFPNTATNIGAYAFRDSGLTDQIIPDTILTIGSYAFGDCEELLCVRFTGTTAPSIAVDAFDGVEGCIVTYPEGALSYIGLFDELLFFAVLPDEDVCGAIGKIVDTNPITGIPILRDGIKITGYSGDPIYAGDRIGDIYSGFADIQFVDNTRIELRGTGSSLHISDVVYKDPSLSNKFRAWLDGGVIRFKSGLMESVKYRIFTRTTVVGVRGTEFEVGYFEAGGMATSTCSVVSGLVNVVELDTGAMTELVLGESNSVVKAVPPPSITVNSPGNGGGSVLVDGSPISSFPYKLTGVQGQEVSVQAVPNSGWNFNGWSGSVEGTNESVIVFINGDAAVQAGFTIDSSFASNLYNTAVANAGLAGADAEVGSIPFSDGVPNLVKYASNMDLSGPDSQRLSGGAGLPVSDISTNSAFQLTYLRSKSGGVVYSPQVSTDLEDWDSFVVPETVTAIDANWEIVTLEQPPSIDATHYYKVDVALP